MAQEPGTGSGFPGAGASLGSQSRDGHGRSRVCELIIEVPLHGYRCLDSVYSTDRRAA